MGYINLLIINTKRQTVHNTNCPVVTLMHTRASIFKARSPSTWTSLTSVMSARAATMPSETKYVSGQVTRKRASSRRRPMWKRYEPAEICGAKKTQMVHVRQT